jgi:uncharacterized membrane protein
MAIHNTPADSWDAVRPRQDAVDHPVVRTLHLSDLRAALASGIEDFGATRTDIIFLCLVYPVMGLALGRIFSGHNLIELLFPLAAGFALVGPAFAVGLNELSRRREQGLSTGWVDMLEVLKSPSLMGISMLAGGLVVIFLLWLQVAELIFTATMGPMIPDAIGDFVREVTTTSAGWTLMVVGIGVGFLFALFVLSITVVSFPLMLDRPAPVNTAIATSLRVMAANPGVMAVWGLIVAAALAIGSLPLFLGLIVVLPVLGHATWHLYRRAVVA